MCVGGGPDEDAVNRNEKGGRDIANCMRPKIGEVSSMQKVIIESR